MKSLISKQVERFLREQKNYKRWLAVFLCLAVVVTIGTTAALRHSGIAATGDSDAAQEMHMEESGETQTVGSEEIPEGMRRHVHTDACYEERKVLVCEEGKAEAGDAADTDSTAPETSEPADTSQGHHHSDSCYEVTGGTEKLTCTKEEHSHDDGCYTVETVTETVTETVPKTVTKEVKNEDGSVTTVEETVDEEVTKTETHEEKTLTCTKEEHSHGSDCYEVEGGERKLICGKEEGEGAETSAATETASEETKAQAESTDANTAKNTEAAEETKGEHVHTDACYELQKVLICGKEEGELEEIPVEEEFKAGELAYRGEDYEIVVSYGPEAEIPEGARLEVEEIPEDSDTYKEYYDKMLDAMAEAEGEEQEITFARLFDITIFSKEGEKIEPKPGKSVEVQIIYDDAVLGEEDDGFAVHFPDDGDTEVIDAEVTDGKEFKHTQSSFSLEFSGGKNKKQTKILTKSGDGFEITVEFEESFKPGTRELVAENITSNNEKNGNGKYQQHSRKAIKDRLDQQEDPEVFGARVFEVSVKEDGKQIGADGVKVTVRYTDKPEKANSAGSKVMVLNDDGDSGRVLSSEAVQKDEAVAVFSGTQNFSAAAPNVMTTMLAAVTLAAEETELQESILKEHPEWLEYLSKEPNNTWQTVEEKYDGNEPGNKPTKGLVAGKTDDHVSIQKNVIPTGTENEFLVYLSIDTKATMEEVLNWDFFGIVTAVNGKEYGAIVSDSSLCPSSVGKNPDGLKNSQEVRFVDENRDFLYGPITVYWDKAAGNASPVVRGSDGSYHLASFGNLDTHATTPLDVVIMGDWLGEWKQQVVHAVSLDKVTDVMGDNIEFVEVLGGNYVESELQTPNANNNNTLTWIPKAKENPVTEGGIEDGYLISHNVAELVYKVRLKVEEEGFNSCASNMQSDADDKETYKVNKSAVLKYSFGKTDNKTSGTATFPVPKVRGLLYDIRAKKVDESGNPIDANAVQNAEFKLKKSDGTSVKHKVNGIDTDVWKPNADGTLDFEDLPWGTYTIVETKSPDRYAAMPEGGTEIGTVTVCWTTDQESLITDPVNSANKLYNGTPQVPDGSEALGKKDNRILIKNKKLPPIMLEKVWDDEQNKKGLRPSDIQFKVEYQNKTDGTFAPVTGIKDVSGNDIGNTEGIVEFTGANDAASWSMVVENLPDAKAYRVTEILRDVPSEDVNYQIKSVSGNDENGVKESGVQYSGKTIKCYTIENELKSRKVELWKIDAASIDAEKFEYLDGAEFKLYDKISGNFETDKTSEEKYTWTSGENGQFFTGELKVGDYWLEETKAPENYKADGPYILHIGMDEITLKKQDGEPVYTGVSVPGYDSTAVRVPNTLNLLSGIKLTKVSDQRGETVLEGAKFVLSKEENGTVEYALVDLEENTVQDWVDQNLATKFESGADGVANLPKLEAGEYALEEVEAPEGYNLLTNTIGFTITVNQTNKNLELKLLADSTTARIDDDYPLNIIITNSAGIVLPEAGGPGTAAYTFGGLAMIIAVSLMYGLNMRRKREKGGLM